jgi:hypothetical protein
MADKNTSRTLVLVSKVSKTLLAVCSTVNRQELVKPIFVSLNKSAEFAFGSIGISPIPLDTKTKHNWQDHDSMFNEVSESYKDILIEDFAVWKSMSLDRLYFWFTGASSDRGMAVLQALDINNVIVSLDLDEPLLWSIAQKFPTIAVQTESIFTREYVDLAAYLPYNQVVV